MIYAFVLAEDGTRLMPTDIRHARRLLKKKEAVIAGHKPFTIRLSTHYQGKTNPVPHWASTTTTKQEINGAIKRLSDETGSLFFLCKKCKPSFCRKTQQMAAPICYI